jgi:hypothetical protein
LRSGDGEDAAPIRAARGPGGKTFATRSKAKSRRKKKKNGHPHPEFAKARCAKHKHGDF